MKIRKKYLLVILFTAAFLLFPKDNAKAACTFSGPGWGKFPAVVALNESISFVVTGNQECANKAVQVEFYGKSGFDFRVQTLISTANSTGRVSGNVTFRASDFSGKSGDQTVYFKAHAQDGSSNTINSPNLTVKLSSGGKCTLTSAQWQWNFKAQPILGSPLHMIVNASGCAGYSVSFKVYSDDVGPNYEMDTVNGKFDSTGTKLDVTWTANNRNDNRPLSSRLGNYNFYFYASADQSKVKSNTVKIPANSQDGCINCNVLPMPQTIQCADGTSINRTLGQDAIAACKNNIGDAKSDTYGGSGCGTPGQPACKSGETKTYFFSIPNPLKGGAEDLSGLVVVIAQWLFNLAIPIAVIMIIYAGVLFLTAQGNTSTIQKAKDVLKWAVVGLAIIFIGTGFVTLIQSILELGAPTP